MINRFIALLLPLFFTLALFMQCSPKVVVDKGSEKIVKVSKLSGQITYTKSYCGGIRPNPNTEELNKTPQPFANQTLFIKQNDTMLFKQPIFHSFATDDNGNFELQLPNGKYAVFIEDKLNNYDNEYAQGKGKEYCQKWLNTPNFKWNIEKNNTNMELKLHIPCNPCYPPAQ